MRMKVTKIPASLLFTLALASHSLYATDETVNMVMNPSFELKYSSNYIPLYWSQFSGPVNSFYISANHKQGDRCLKITDNSSTASVGLWTDPMPVTPGWVYTARTWACRTVTTMYGLMYLRFYDDNDNLLLNSSVSVGTNGSWTQAEKTATAPEGASYVRLLLYSTSTSTGGSIYFDCTSLILANQRVNDGGFSDSTAGDLPEHWSVYSTHSGAIQDAAVTDNNAALRLYDVSSSASCGVYYQLPASPGVPYKLSASGKKTDGSGSALIYLKFYDSDGTQLSSYSAGTSSSTYTALDISQTAPSGTAYAKALCYISSTGTGTAYFDNISFAENYTQKYAAPAAAGNGSGSSAQNAAAYTSGTFWNTINIAAETAPVKVTLLSGNYTNYSTISSVGNSSNQILVAGETPFAANFNYETGCDMTNQYLWIYGCTNMVFRHLHFTADESTADLQSDTANYNYAVPVGRSGYPSQDLCFEGLTFTDLLLMNYGATGAHSDTHDITWNRCSWTRVGYDLYDHCIYSSYGSYNISIEDCYFQDCNGTYVRFRDESKGKVQNCTFISTGAQPTGDSQNRKHWAFIQICAMNPYDSARDEKLGDSFVFKNNAFTYEQTSESGYLSPYQIYVMGKAPTSEPTFHLVPVADGEVIADITESTPIRNTYFEYYFGIDPAEAFDISGNSYSGCWSIRCCMNIYPYPLSYWTVAPSETESENIDMDKLVGID